MSLNHTNHIVNVIIPLHLGGTFTYTISHEQFACLQPGMRVLVPFGKTKVYTAIVLDIHQIAVNDIELKEIIDIIDSQPIVTETQLLLWKWISSYYMCSLGEVYVAALPSVFRLENETLIQPNTEYDCNLLSEDEQQLIASLFDKKKNVKYQDITKFATDKKKLRSINVLIQKGVLIIFEDIKEKVLPKTVSYIRCTDYGMSILEKNDFEHNKAPKQILCLQAYADIQKEFDVKQKTIGIPKTTLIQKANVSDVVIKELIKKKIFETHLVEISRFQYNQHINTKQNTLTAIQQQSFSEIKKMFNIDKAVLLHGVTASGKTQIYIELIKECISNNKQVLFLVPEIALTVQLMEKLQQEFGQKVGIYHSKYNEQERAEVYQNLLSNNPYQIIIGVRSSIFLPFVDLGLVIIDEEHETSYKQFEPAPRYHARNAAMMLASISKANVILGTATPSLETFHNAMTGKYAYVQLTTRYSEVNMPSIEVVDIKDAYKKNRMKAIFSWRMIEEIEQSLKDGEQVVLFQNRRGYAMQLECMQCGWVPKCVACDVSLTQHLIAKKMSCHYCGHSETIPNKCPKCGNIHLKEQGYGTEKIANELQKLFPSYAIGRMDSDTTSKKHGHASIIHAFEQKKIDVLIGTQMVTKGLHFDNVSLVGVLNADNLFNYPDFRSNERAFQMLVQVSGRAGRSNKQGRVILQTFLADLPYYNFICENNYQAFYQFELQERQMFLYPPYCKIISIYVKHKKLDEVESAINLLATELRGILGNRVLGPDNPPIAKVQYIYSKKIMIKVENKISYELVKQKINEKINLIANSFKSVRIIVDVDPM